MRKFVRAGTLATVLVCAGAAPASATFDTGRVVDAAGSALNRPGVCVTYGTIPVATVYDPTRPGQPLVFVTAPIVQDVYFC